MLCVSRITTTNLERVAEDNVVVASGGSDSSYASISAAIEFGSARPDDLAAVGTAVSIG
jgi:hypothetical protein